MFNISDVELEKFYTVAEVAELLRASPRTIRRYCRDNILSKTVRLKKAWLIPGESILELLGLSEG